MELTASQSSIVSETLRVALLDGALVADDSHAKRLDEAAALLGTAHRDPHPAMPAPGSTVTVDLEVTAEDTAAAMGHPDAGVAVLGSPRISLWFELVASRAMPDAATGTTSLGVGILVHHLGAADVGELVTVTATVESVSGRRITFSCAAHVGGRLVALGTHQRMLVETRAGA